VLFRSHTHSNSSSPTAAMMARSSRLPFATKHRHGQEDSTTGLMKKFKSNESLDGILIDLTQSHDDDDDDNDSSCAALDNRETPCWNGKELKDLKPPARIEPTSSMEDPRQKNVHQSGCELPAVVAAITPSSHQSADTSSLSYAGTEPCAFSLNSATRYASTSAVASFEWALPSEVSPLEKADDASVGDDFGHEPYSLQEFEDMLSKIEENIAVSIEDVEHGTLVTKSNNSVSKENTTFQDKAMYGRTMSALAEHLFNDIFRLQYWHIFVDIGHGIGTLCLHASMTRGCESRGIEVCHDRNFLAQHVYLEEFQRLHAARKNERRFGKVSFRHGRLEDIEQRQNIIGGDKVFCNNFNYVFGCRSQHKVDYSPDTYIAGLFCLMKDKAEMVTLGRLDLPPSREQVNAYRLENGLPKRDDASFFDLDITHDSGGDRKLSFTREEFKIFKYTRVTKYAQWFCWNPDCRNSDEPIRAWEEVDISKSSDRTEMRVIPVTKCDRCNIRKSSRDRKKTDKYGANNDNDGDEDEICSE